jgi:hypothetical protein
LNRMDSQQLPRRILNVSQSEALRLGIGRSTLHYLRENASSERAFKVYRKVSEKLAMGDRSIA